MQRVAVGEHNKERMEHHLLLVKEGEFAVLGVCDACSSTFINAFVVACNWKDFEFSLKLGEISPEFVCQGARWKVHSFSERLS